MSKNKKAQEGEKLSEEYQREKLAQEKKKKIVGIFSIKNEYKLNQIEMDRKDYEFRGNKCEDLVFEGSNLCKLERSY